MVPEQLISLSPFQIEIFKFYLDIAPE